MDDTHKTADSDDGQVAGNAEQQAEEGTSADALAALDPADAPDLAEQLAAELAEDLEAAGASQPEPTQLVVDFDDPSDPAVQ